MLSLELLNDFDIFFYYGEPTSDLDTEIQSEVLQGLMQPRGQLFYDNSDGAGIIEQENAPVSLAMQVGVRANIVNWIAYRNSFVTDGTNGNPDRRVGVSQASIDITTDTGKISVTTTMLPFKDAKKPMDVSVPISGNN